MTKRHAHLGQNQLDEVAALLDSDSTTLAPTASQKDEAQTSFVN
jgi:hypothetical protein